MISLLASQVAAWVISAVMLYAAPNYLGAIDLGHLRVRADRTRRSPSSLGLLGTNWYIVKTTTTTTVSSARSSSTG